MTLADRRPGSDKLAELTRAHPWIVALARAGWVAKGVVYGLVGVLAVPIALDGIGGDGTQQADDEASQAGAIGRIAESPLGGLVLWLVALGLVLYVAWRLVSVLLPAEHSASAWATRAGYVASMVVSLSLAWTAISFARHRRSAEAESNEDARVERFTRELMDMTGGRWIVGLAGVAVVAIGISFVYRGVTASFRDELDGRGVGPIGHSSIVRLGQAGWVGRGTMMLLVGWFVVRAAATFDPDDAQGLDGALRDATGSTAGALLVCVVAAGLVLYGAFCAVSAPRVRLTGAD